MKFYLIFATVMCLCANAADLLVTSNQTRNYPGCRDISTALDDKTNIYACPSTVQSQIAVGDKVEVNTMAVGFAVASWGLDRIDQKDLPLDNNFNPGPFNGQNVNVYVIDSGVITTHPEFEGRALFLSNHVPDGRTTDCVGHGTHVAGTIMSKSYGVAKQATVYSVRVLGCDNSGAWSWIIEGINSAVAHAKTTGKPSVINMSLGGGSTEAVKAAVKAATDAGVHVVVAAGNHSICFLIYYRQFCY
jgi:subtilisin family serine protease